MNTTIQVSVTTKQSLELLKKKEKVPNYDAVICNLLDSNAKISKSLFGSVKGLKWSKEDRLKLHEL